MAPERGKKSPSTVAAECGADEILIVNIALLYIFSYQIFNMYYCMLLRIVMIQNHWNQVQLQHQSLIIF
jgi:hypothetical protein